MFHPSIVGAFQIDPSSIVWRDITQVEFKVMELMVDCQGKTYQG